MGSFVRPLFDVKRIAIIGAGPSGLAVAKFLAEERAFDHIQIFEQQSEVGGVWNYSSNIAGHIAVPQTSPHNPPELPIWPEGAPAPLFSNPMYDHLNTNIPKGLMNFSDQDFLPESLLFPSREDVQDYLVKYSRDVRQLIRFSTQVEDVRQTGGSEKPLWKLVSRSIITGEQEKHRFDAIVVATGHYSVPYMPAVSGIESFNSAYPSIITHSKVYRSPTPFTGKKVIVVGNAASGLDIGIQIGQVCKRPLLNSVHTPSSLDLGNQDKEEVPAIAEFLGKERGVRFENGRVETDIDAIIYCTGYLYSYPFLKSMDLPVVTTGRRVIGLYRQLFNIDRPTLAFTALQKKIIPFPLSEVQGAAIAKVWSNKLDLPGREEMVLLEKKQLEERGDGTNFHVLGYPKDAEYINDLHGWVKNSSDGFAKVPAFWGKKELWLREINTELKKKFIEEGEQARTTKVLEYELNMEDK
jgi:cation diffusion facilitator CzcD-associated flavoprotein CzcO